LLTVHPNKSRLLLVLGEEDGEFMVIMTGLHEVEVLVTK
jgi:lipoate synthase